MIKSDLATPDFAELTSEGEYFSLSDEDDAQLLDRILEDVYSCKPHFSALDPAERDLLLLLDKVMPEVGEDFSKLGLEIEDNAGLL